MNFLTLLTILFLIFTSITLIIYFHSKSNNSVISNDLDLLSGLGIVGQITLLINSAIYILIFNTDNTKICFTYFNFRFIRIFNLYYGII